MPFLGLDWRDYGSNWVKVDGNGWVLTGLSADEAIEGTSASTFILNRQFQKANKSQKMIANQTIQQSTPDNRSDENSSTLWQPCLRNIQGMGKEKRIMNTSLSEALNILDLEIYGSELRGFQYCADFYAHILEKKFNRLSGTTQRHIFKVIEEMVSTAMKNETHIPVVKKLLEIASSALHEGRATRIGSDALWKKHQDVINNCTTRFKMFQYSERQQDDKPGLLDLPKETLQKILSYLTDPKDLLSAGSTCFEMNEISKDLFLWRDLCLYHFSEKQLCGFLDDLEFNEIDWLDIFKGCVKRKYKMNRKIPFGDELVLCNNCRGMFWRIAGHQCANPEMWPSYLSCSPSDFTDIFRL